MIARRLSFGEKVRPREFAYVIAVAICTSTFSRSLGDYKEYVRRKNDALRPLRDRYSSIAAFQTTGPMCGTVDDRLAVVDKIVNGILREYEFLSSSSIGDLLSEERLAPDRSLGRKGSEMALIAAELFTEHRDQFEGPMGASSLDKTEKDIVLGYYDTAMGVASACVAQQAKTTCALAKEKEASVLELALVLPLLHVHDSKWSPQQVDALPRWMKTTRYLKTLEAFSLKVHRPLTAYHFHLKTQENEGKATWNT